MIIAVDGGSGTGKSTVCRLVAAELGFTYIDTGAIYRSVALAVTKANVALDDDAALKKICDNLNFSFDSPEIRTPQIAMMASKVSALAVVRNALLEMQKKLAKNAPKGAVVDGRDMGTVVFPNAELKIFLTASDQVRARRRYEELKSKGMNVNYEQILKETIQRDKQDSERSIAPLKKANDAVEIDTDGLSIQEVKQKIISLIKKH